MVYHRSEPCSGDPRRQGRFSRDEDSNSREPRRDDRHDSRSKDGRYSDSDSRSYRDDRYSSRYPKEGRGREDSSRSRSRDRSDSSRYRGDRDRGRGLDKPGYNSGSRYSAEDEMSYRYQDSPRYGSGGSAYRYQSPSSYHDQGSNSYPSNNVSYQKPEQPIPEEEKLQNQFQNDGSFLEMFKKMQQSATATTVKTEGTAEAVAGNTSLPVATSTSSVLTNTMLPKPPIVGKRRGGRVLKTGMVKKVKKEDPEEEKPKDAWSLYMNEVRKYKEASCEEEGKTRPLVK